MSRDECDFLENSRFMITQQMDNFLLKNHLKKNIYLRIKKYQCAEYLEIFLFQSDHFSLLIFYANR